MHVFDWVYFMYVDTWKNYNTTVSIIDLNNDRKSDFENTWQE